MATTDELLDILMKNYKKPEDLIGENGLLKQLTKRLLERAMQAELTEHLGYEKQQCSSCCIWLKRTLLKNGPCRSGTGSQH